MKMALNVQAIWVFSIFDIGTVLINRRLDSKTLLKVIGLEAK